MSPPTIYIPPSRYTSKTPTAVPILVRAIRAGAVLMFDWCTLRFIDHAPASVWIITAIFALLILAVLESRDWLNFKGKNYFIISLVSLVLLWLGLVVFAYVRFGIDPAVPAAVGVAGPAPSLVSVAPQPSTPVSQPAQQAPVIGSLLGPLTTLQMRSSLGARPHGTPAGSPAPGSFPIELRWALIITAPRDNQEIADLLYKLMGEADLRVQRLEAPDHSLHLDAPDFPQPEAAGITLHGTNVLNARLLSVLQPCIIVRSTGKTIDGLREWYRDKVVQEQEIVWIEIGNGSPWTRDSRCWK
jgi:hypothetical protein